MGPVDHADLRCRLPAAGELKLWVGLLVRSLLTDPQARADHVLGLRALIMPAS